MRTGDATHGPYVHGLNKGGLSEIWRSQKLRATSAGNHMANDRLAVRAYVGTFEHQKRNKNWSGADKTFVEFLTFTAPRSGLPPGYAEWTEGQLDGGYLRVKILRVLDGNGITIFPAQFPLR
jgi:hypothetical protein